MLLFGSNALAITLGSTGIVTVGLFSLLLLGAIIGGLRR